jgi:hypothetical protein
VKVQEKYRDQGLIVIGSHCQNVDKEKVLGLCRSQKVNYTITSNGRPQGDSSKGIPQAYLFDWTGKCVGEGKPDALYGKLDELMANAPSPIVGAKTYDNEKVQKVALKLRANRGFGKLTGELEKLSGKLEGEGQAEAQDLLGRLTAHGERLKARAQAAEGEDAGAAYSSWTQLSSLFKGADLGDEASKRLKELKKDKPFQKELKAAQMAAGIEELCGKLVSTGGTVHLDHPSNRGTAAAIQKGLKAMQKKYPDQKATARAKAAAATYGL